MLPSPKSHSHVVDAVEVEVLTNSIVNGAQPASSFSPGLHVNNLFGVNRAMGVVISVITSSFSYAQPAALYATSFTVCGPGRWMGLVSLFAVEKRMSLMYHSTRVACEEV